MVSDPERGGAMIRSGFRVMALLVAGAMPACAHGGFKAPDDPVEEARLRLNEVLGAPGDVVCAAQVVEGEWGLQALQGLGSPEAKPRFTGVAASTRWRAYQASQMSLSQASQELSQSLADYKTAQANAYNGVSGARRMAHYAMAQFDAVHQAVTSRPAVKRQSRDAGASVANAQYATVWTEYLSAEEATEGRDQILDWLTTRSVANLPELRSYHQDFLRALRKKCG
jgi:hypothetical protein